MLKGYRTYAVFGVGLLGAIGLLIWCHFEPGLLSDSMQSLLEGIAMTSTIGLGLRKITTTPPGQAGE